MTDKSVIPSLKSDHFLYVDSHTHFLLRLARHMEPSQDLWSELLSGISNERCRVTYISYLHKDMHSNTANNRMRVQVFFFCFFLIRQSEDPYELNHPVNQINWFDWLDDLFMCPYWVNQIWVFQILLDLLRNTKLHENGSLKAQWQYKLA